MWQRLWPRGGRTIFFAVALSIAPAIHAGVPGDDPPRLVEVVIAGDLGPFEEAELEEFLRTRPNRRLFGVPGLTPSVWLYQLGTETTAIGRALRRAGEPPTTYDGDAVESDRVRLQELFRQAGYLQAAVEVGVEQLPTGHARVTFTVIAGPASVVRGVTFDGIDHLTRDERRVLIEGSALRLLPDTVALALPRPVLSTAPGQRLSEAELLAERRRLLAELRDLGFARITRDSIRVVAHPIDTLDFGEPVFDIDLRVGTGPRYAFGDVRFVVHGPESAPARIDTVQVGNGLVVTSISDERSLSPVLLRRALRFEPGDRYRQSDLLNTKQRLDASGVFTFSEITPLWHRVEEPTGLDSLPTLPHRLTLRTRPRHTVRLDGFVLRRDRVLDGETVGFAAEELGLGAGVTYRNANAFGRGEEFSVGLSGSVAGDFVSLPSGQIEGTAGLRMPYLIWPFRPVERLLDPYDVRTRVTTGFMAARRDELRLLIRGRATAGVRLELHHSPSIASYIDVLDFQLSDPDTLFGFREQFLDLIEDPVAQQFVLEDYTNPQINNALRYTFRSSTADPFRRDRGHSFEAAIEVGGNLPYLLDRFVFTPGEVEGSIPGPPLFGGGSRLEYRPYLRAVVDARRYLNLGEATILAFKGATGVAHPTGRAPVVPFDRRFYIGGVGSVRGWDLRHLGPGRVPADASAFVQGGDIKLEAGAELRQIVLRNLLAADWQLALFADAGNIWFGPRNPGDPDGRFRLSTFPQEIAVGAGTGLRVAWDFLILRFDLAWQVRSPVPGDPLFPEGSTPRLHFGIGQAF